MANRRCAELVRVTRRRLDQASGEDATGRHSRVVGPAMDMLVDWITQASERRGVNPTIGPRSPIPVGRGRDST